ncbi:hypothetical protein PIB30_080986, partial [Stylosanthes scabra]|nr:hypothetical protein [Stylosanthes scabra]
MSIRALEVARKGLPKIKGAPGSSSMSRITKSIGKKNFPTFTNIFSTIPCACLTVLSAICKITLVGFISLIPSFFIKDSGMRLMLDPKSHNALSNMVSPMMQGMRKLPGSFFLV